MRLARVFTPSILLGGASSLRPTTRAGRRLTCLTLDLLTMSTMSVSPGATKVRPTPDHVRSSESRRPLPEMPTLVDGAGAVTVLRRRPAVPAGALGSGVSVEGRRLVAARDLHDAPWWVPAAAVWSDAEVRERPERPWHVGLATDRSWSRAVLTGLSNRLGWEARVALERGERLPVLRALGPCGAATVHDGRLGHEVPTVHIASPNVSRGGAGSTIESAYHRALFGDEGTPEVELARELADVELVLADAGLHVAVVDLGTSLLRHAGVFRVSIQLMTR